MVNLVFGKLIRSINGKRKLLSCVEILTFKALLNVQYSIDSKIFLCRQNPGQIQCRCYAVYDMFCLLHVEGQHFDYYIGNDSAHQHIHGTTGRK